MPRFVQALVFALVASLMIASGAHALGSESALGENFEHGSERVGALAPEALRTRQQSASHATTIASESPHAARGIPQIVKGSNPEMLGQAVKHVQALAGTAAEKAALFERLAPQITELSGKSWSAARSLGADGSHIFTGGLGEALVISPTGQLFRGSVAQAGNFTVGPSGALQPVYQALRAIAGAP